MSSAIIKYEQWNQNSLTMCPMKSSPLFKFKYLQIYFHTINNLKKIQNMLICLIYIP